MLRLPFLICSKILKKNKKLPDAGVEDPTLEAKVSTQKKSEDKATAKNPVFEDRPS